MENKSAITFSGCKPSQNTTLSLIKTLLVLYERNVEVLGELQDTNNIER